jgi:hypothetical protein
MNQSGKNLKIGILKRLRCFRAFEKLGIPNYLQCDVIPPGQKLLGAYENVPNSKVEAIFVTNTSLWCVFRRSRATVPADAGPAFRRMPGRV